MQHYAGSKHAAGDKLIRIDEKDKTHADNAASYYNAEIIGKYRFRLACHHKLVRLYI